MLMLGCCRLINGCTESGNRSTTGMAALFPSCNECGSVCSEKISLLLNMCTKYQFRVVGKNYGGKDIYIRGL